MLLEINITHEILLALGFTAAFGLMFFFSELIYTKLKVDVEMTRKFIHVTCGSIAMLIPFLRPQVFTMISLGVLFSLLTFYMMRKGLLPSVNAVKRHTIGSILYPLGIICCALCGLRDDYRVYFFIPLSTLVFSDTVAALVGINYPLKKFTVKGFSKSVGGSLGFFTSAFILCFCFLCYFNPGLSSMQLFVYSLQFGLGTAFIEMISVDGWDDITVPVSSYLILLMLGV
ncbi:MAG: hypothetical protein NTW54_01440 [Bacteroidetes bacterium]|nr:hypothetical protein [Bacteroidota bacterium]